MNASLEDSTNWKLNLYSEYIPESTKRLKVNDIVWLHHSECNATLAATRKVSAFNKAKFHTTELTKWISLENMQVGVHYSGISESSFEQYSGNTYSMWILENVDYKVGGYIQYERYYRLKHFATGLYLSVQRPPPELPPPPPENKDPYAVKRAKKNEEVAQNLVSNKEPPAKYQLSTTPDKSTLFEFKPLKDTDVEKKFIDSGAFVFLQSVEHKKYLDIISRLDEEHGQKQIGTQSKHLAEFLKPVLRNEKEKSEYAVFKLYQANASESLEVMFLESCQKVLFKLLYYLTGFKFKGDASDKELLKIFDKKIAVATKATAQLD